MDALLAEDRQNKEEKEIQKMKVFKGKCEKRSGNERWMEFGGWFLPVSPFQSSSHQMAQQHEPYFCGNAQTLLFILNLQHILVQNTRREKIVLGTEHQNAWHRRNHLSFDLVGGEEWGIS